MYFLEKLLAQAATQVDGLMIYLIRIKNLNHGVQTFMFHTINDDALFIFERSKLIISKKSKLIWGLMFKIKQKKLGIE